MKALTRAELARSVSKVTGYHPELVEEIVEHALVTINDAVCGGRRVELRGFGVWSIKMSKAKIGFNPQRIEDGPIEIPARPVVRFKPGKDMIVNIPVKKTIIITQTHRQP